MTPPLVKTVRSDELKEAAVSLRQRGGRMQMVYAWYPEPHRIELRYVFREGAGHRFAVWRCEAKGSIPSLSDVWPLLGWHEREISDLFGLFFEGHPEPHRLVLHDGVEGPLPPFNPDYAFGTPLQLHRTMQSVPEVAGAQADVQLLPFGPVRADVVESGEFLFFYIGEAILHFQPRLFFKHRGMEKRFEGLSVDTGVVLSERVSGVGSVAHAVAYCQAVEAAANCDVPARARFLRVLLAELERLYNHLHYLGHLAHTTTLKVGEAEGKLLEERVKQMNAKLTGSRFLRSILAVGGLRRDLAPQGWLASEIESLREDYVIYARHLESTNSHLDRLITTGHLDTQIAFDQGATGPVARASSIDHDLRRDFPYAAYSDVPVDVSLRKTGDAHARAQVRMAEIIDSIALIQRVLLLLPDGPVLADCAVAPQSEGLGWSESPRGTLLYAVHFDANGRLARVKIKSPSFSNWRAFPSTVHDSNMMDYAINEASFGLTIAGCDR
jgi:Ni,Fe-hydrogenase III large subunit/NADH:ubiquinone oxidoreductase subunit C